MKSLAELKRRTQWRAREWKAGWLDGQRDKRRKELNERLEKAVRP